MGDLTYHWGRLNVEQQIAERSVALFERALALDPTYVLALEHLPELYLERGDTLNARRSVERLAAIDSVAYGLAGMRYVVAVASGDSNTARMLRERKATMDLRSQEIVVGTARLGSVNIHPAVVEEFWQVAVDKYHVPSIAPWLVERGQPARANRALEMDDLGYKNYVAIVSHAFLDGDSAGAVAAALRVETSLRVTPSRTRQYALSNFMLGVNAMSRSDTSSLRQRVANLKAYTADPDDPVSQKIRSGAALLLETILATVQRSTTLGTLAARLDSTVRAGGSGAEVDAPTPLVLARAREALGDIHGAWSALRYPQFRDWNSFDAPQLRERARLAELVGDREDAIAAWRAYVKLRADAEPSLQPDLARARAALARLERTSSGK